MKCNCCGEEISQVLIRKFFADGSDSNVLADIDDLGDDCYGIDTDQNWTGYILDEDDKDVYNTILCPKCNEFPFMDKEIHQQEIVQLTFWNEQELYADNEAIKTLEQEPCEGIIAIHTQGLDEGIRCAMCTNSLKSDRGCDGGCVVNEDMYKEVMNTIRNRIVPSVTPALKTGNWKRAKDKTGHLVWECDKCGCHPDFYCADAERKE